MTALRRPAAIDPIELAAPAPPSSAGRERLRPQADARALQARASAWAQGEAAGFNNAGSDRWSARRMLAFAVGASLLLWGGVALMAWAVVRSLA